MAKKTPADGRPVTLEHVARVAGVSRATVSRVVNRSPTVDPALRRAVEKAIAATKYVPNRAARSLVTRTTDSVALLVSEAEPTPGASPFVGRVFTDPYFGRIVSGLLDELRPRSRQLVLMVVDDAESRSLALNYLQQGHVDGAIVLSTHPEDPLPALLAEARVPVVLSSRPLRPIPISYVEADQRSGVALAVDRLVAIGRRRLATVTGPLDTAPGRERLAAFQESLARHGLPLGPMAEGDFTQAGGAAAMRRLLAEHAELDGVFVASDLMAAGALPVLTRTGRRVPEDVAVIGFDDSSAALSCDPPLTTVRQPVEEMAGHMAQLLLRQIAEPESTLQSSVFQPALVVRDSA
jgi:DNA-binding LacI/PurR family transcriptional regulator